MIESIRLRSWKTHADSTLEFGKGTNVLVGRMGSGKTSILEGICFALFGTFPALQSRKISLQEVVQSKPNEAAEAVVELHFDYSGKKYAVERTIKRKGSSEALLYCDGRFIAGPKPSDVTAAVEKAIEINFNLFSRAVYSEQNEIDFFLRLAPRERKQRFDELLDLQRYETVRANAVSVANRLRGIVKDRKALMQEQRAVLSSEEEQQLHKKIVEKEKEAAEAEKKVREKEKELQALQKEVATLEGKEKESSFCREQLVKAKAKAEELGRAIEETAKQAKGKTIAALQHEEKSLKQEVEEKEKKLKGLQSEEKSLRSEESTAEKTIALSEKKLDELKEHLQQLQGITAACPVCKRKLETATRGQLIAENKTEQKKAGEEKKKAEKQLEEIALKIEKAGNEIEKTRDEQQATHEKEIELRHLNEQLQALAEKELQLKQFELEAEKAAAQLNAIGFDEKRLREKRRLFIGENAAIESSKKGIESAAELVKELQKRLQQIKQAREQMHALEKKIAAIEQNTEKLNYFNNALQAAQNELRELLISTINEAMQNIWQKIYPYADFKTAKMCIEEGSYELKVLDNMGNWVRVEGILSGGERSAAAICIRMAFSLVLTRNLSWLILDEPTHNLDSNAVSTLSRMMQLHLPALVDQVFVITHDNEMRKAASANLYLLERDKDQNGVTKPMLLPIQEYTK